MSVVDRDTSPSAHLAQIDALRRMGPARRASVAFAMSDDLRRLALDGIMRRNPQLDARGRIRALVALLHGEELARKAFPDLLTS